jgi:hypothetical protein
MQPEDQNVVENPQQVEGGQAAAGGPVKLGIFWPHSPALWFSQAECQFLVRGVTDSFARYCHVVAVLPHESLRLVADLVETLPKQSRILVSVFLYLLK